MYILEVILSGFQLVARPALTLVPTKFDKNWQTEYIKFLKIDDLKLNLKVYIKYKSTIQNLKIEISIKKNNNIKVNTTYYQYLFVLYHYLIDQL